MRGSNGKSNHFFKGVLIGGLGGALAGLLFAPKAGKKLRDEIADKGSEALKDTKEFCFDAREKAKRTFRDATGRPEMPARRPRKRPAGAKKTITRKNARGVRRARRPAA